MDLISAFGGNRTKKADPVITLDSADILTLVSKDDVTSLRSYFDQSLHGHDIVRPDWSHLCLALSKNNPALLRLLVTWGATPTEQKWNEYASFLQESGHGARLTREMRALKLAGISWLNLPVEAIPAPVNETSKNIFPVKVMHSVAKRIPEEWRAVLKAFQDCGAPESVIAGGALRDLTCYRKIKDVDIFLSDRMMNRALITKAFAAAGIAIHLQENGGGYDFSYKKMTRSHSEVFAKVSMRQARDGYGGLYTRRDVKYGAESWRVIAGPKETEYNIVFVKGPLGKEMRDRAAEGHSTADQILDQFDIGLCQVAYDGQFVRTKMQFIEDMHHRRLTLLKPDDIGALDHLKRIMRKYPDFKPCPEAKRMLNPKPPGIPLI